MKKRNSCLCALLVAVASLQLMSCRKYETYTELKEKEMTHIERFIDNGGIDGRPIKVITEAEFYAQDSTTNVEENEYVLFKSTGVYMQIVRKGEGRAQRSGENRNYLARYVEVSVAKGDTMTMNLYETNPESMTIKRVDDTFSGTFTNGVMLRTYGGSSSTAYSYYYYSTSTFPEGWLLPFSYITPGRPNDKAAKVRLILPHDSGTQSAQQQIYAAFYEITIMPEP